jgi:hypothetical protein
VIDVVVADVKKVQAELRFVFGEDKQAHSGTGGGLFLTLTDGLRERRATAAAPLSAAIHKNIEVTPPLRP